jgi:hypothetical protein
MVTAGRRLRVNLRYLGADGHPVSLGKALRHVYFLLYEQPSLDDDLANLNIALDARRMNPDIRVVIRWCLSSMRARGCQG